MCGDVSDDLDALEETLEGFKRAAFAEVFLYVRQPRALVGRSRRDARDEGFQGEDRGSVRDVRENRGADVADEGLRWALDRTGALVPS